jgi:malonyl-CoA O-methyltransferase
MAPAPTPLSTRRALDAAAVGAALRRAARSEPPWLHLEVARRMGERLSVIRLQPQWLIDWWGFTGAGASPLAAAYPKARRVVVEPTLALAERSRAAAQSPWWSARRWRGASVEVLVDEGGTPALPIGENPGDPAPAPRPLSRSTIPESAPLVWANMMLHAHADPPALFARWHRLLQTDGFVMFSCLGPGTLLELRRLYARLGWPTPAAEFVDMHDLGDMLVHAGFADPVLDQETLTLHWASAQDLLAELRSLGANAAPGRFAGLRTPRWRERLLRELESLAGPDGRLRLSFEVAYGHAFKAPPRVRTGEPTTVSLADMRAMVRSRNTAGKS